MAERIVTIMGIPFQNIRQRAFIDEQVVPHVTRGEPCHIVTANPEIVMETRKNSVYKRAVLSANYIVPDGIGILLAAKWKGTPLLERIAGYDVMIDLLHYANNHKATCYLLGGTEAVNEQAKANIQAQF